MICFLRKEIDKIDKAILDLINRRLEFVKKVGQFKHKGKACVIDTVRERKVLSRLDRLNAGLLESNALHDIFSDIISASRAMQKEKFVAYIPSEIDIVNVLRSKYLMSRSVFYLEVSNKDSFVEKIEDGSCDYGLISLDSRNKNSISRFMDLLSSDFYIYTEYCNEINYEIVSKTQDCKTLDIAYIPKSVTKRCYSWLKDCLPDIRIVKCDSILDVIIDVSKNEKLSVVGLAGAASLFGLNILFSTFKIAKCVNHRYFLICKEKPILSKSNRNKTSLLCLLSNKTGLLLKAVETLQDINIASIEVERCYSGYKSKYSLFLIGLTNYNFSKEFTLVLDKFHEHFLWVKNLGTYSIEEGVFSY